MPVPGFEPGTSEMRDVDADRYATARTNDNWIVLCAVLGFPEAINKAKTPHW